MTIKKLSSARQTLKSLRKSYLTFGRIIESIRLGEGLAQIKLAKMLNISRAYLCDIEKGRRKVSPTKAAEFAKILGYSAEQFIAIVIEEELNEAGFKLKVELSAA